MTILPGQFDPLVVAFLQKFLDTHVVAHWQVLCGSDALDLPLAGHNLQLEIATFPNGIQD